VGIGAVVFKKFHLLTRADELFIRAVEDFIAEKILFALNFLMGVF
jgi:hypothetical protein